MDRDEKIAAGLFFLAVYMLVGIAVGWVLDDGLGLVPLEPDSPISEYMALVLLWPLFVLKFLAIGLWSVLYSGFSLLF